MEHLGNYIAGASVPAASGRTMTRLAPATGEPCLTLPDSDSTDVDAAVTAAAGAFPPWSARPASERSSILHAVADAIDTHADALARAESRDTGKPLSLARSVDIPRSAANFRFFADAILHASSEAFFTEAPPPSQAVGSGISPGAAPLPAAHPFRALNYTLRRPRGVAGLISPWNLPLYLLTWKIAPALATGNTAVCKPSELTPSTAAMLADLATRAGLPPGVLNIVHGSGTRAGAPIVTHQRVPALSFTGSTGVGRWIAEHAGARLKRVSLELGGKNPFIIFDDAPMSEAIDTACRAAFTNQGQICLCGSRLLVQRRAFDHVLAAIARHAQSLRVGDPDDPATEQGALISPDHLRKVDRLVQQARSLGGIIHAGGTPVDPARLPARCRAGSFYAPTVISGLDPLCAVEQEEIFGPVVTLQPFDTEDDAIELANNTPYGLAATLFTRDASRLHRLAARLDAGIVWANCWMIRDLRTPFGGAKDSGVGREGGAEALHFFTESTSVCVRT
ncbi:MAG: aldehyde dehydrogenase [Phycisphaerales bacterium]